MNKTQKSAIAKENRLSCVPCSKKNSESKLLSIRVLYETSLGQRFLKFSLLSGRKTVYNLLNLTCNVNFIQSCVQIHKQLGLWFKD